jgi:hypothetical protein
VTGGEVVTIFESIRKLWAFCTTPSERYCMFCHQKMTADEGIRIYTTWENDLVNTSTPATSEVRSSFYPSHFCAERCRDYHPSCYEQRISDIDNQPRSVVVKATLVALATQEYAKFEKIWDEKERKQRAVLKEIAKNIQKEEP